MEMEISDPGNERRWVLVLTKKRVRDRLRNRMLVVRDIDKKGQITREENFLIEIVLASSFIYNSMAQCLAYKRVAVKVQQVLGMMPSGIRIVRWFPKDLLETLLSISPYPPLFVLGIHLMKKRTEGIELLSNTFL